MSHSGQKGAAGPARAAADFWMPGVRGRRTLGSEIVDGTKGGIAMYAWVVGSGQQR